MLANFEKISPEFRLDLAIKEEPILDGSLNCSCLGVKPNVTHMKFHNHKIQDHTRIDKRLNRYTHRYKQKQNSHGKNQLHNSHEKEEHILAWHTFEYILA